MVVKELQVRSISFIVCANFTFMKITRVVPNKIKFRTRLTAYYNF